MAIVTGDQNNNNLVGTSLADELYGLEGNDTLNGAGGADRLVGGLGADTLTGGAGADIYVFNSAADSTGANRDIITDFVTGDRIDLTTLSSGPLVWSGTTPRSWGVWYTQIGGNTFVSADTNGDGVEDFSLQLTGTIALAATHFIGVNLAPDLRGTTGDTIARSVTETNAGLTTTGTLTVTDPDSVQTVSVAVVATSFSGTPEAVAAVQAAASGWLSVTAGALAAETADRNNVTWTFDSGSEAFNFLKNGQSLQIIYTIEATDSNLPGAGRDTQNVTITINGRNDGPQIVAGAGNSSGATVAEGAASLVASGTLGVVDPDQFDTFTGSVYAVATSGPTGGLSATTLRGYLTVGITPGATSPQSTASLGWTFNPGSQAFDFLAEGDTLTLSYTVRATDAAGSIGSSVVTIVVQGQNDAAVLTGSATRAYTENAAAVSIYNNTTLTLTDVDDTVFPSAQVSISDNFRAGQDVLSFTNTSATTYGDIGASYNETTGVLSLVSASGTATRLQWQSALRNVRYANASNAPDTATRTISFQIDDGGSVNGLSNIATSTVTITATNDAPQIIADAGDVASAGVQEGAAGLTASGALSIVDPDQLDLLTPSVYAVSTIGPAGGISATTLRSFLTVAVTPETTSPQTTASLGWTFDSGSQAFNHLAEGQTLTLNYTVRATDATGAYGSHLVTIVIQGQNDAPVLAGAGTRAYTENAAPQVVHSTIALTDIDDTTFVSAQVSITGGSHAGQDVLSFTNTSATTYGNIQATYDAGTGVLSLVSEDGSATLGQWQSALRNVRYANTSNAPDTTSRTINFQINDGGSVNGLSNIATSTVTITAVNDAPLILAAANATVTEGAASLAASGTLSVVDPDQLDSLAASVYAVSTTGPTGGIPAATLRSFLSVAAVLDSTSPQTTASLGWTFNPGSQAFDFLAEGETLTLNYTVRATDAAGAYGSNVVTITIQGQNDAPVLAGAGTRAYTENAAPQIVHSTIALTDIDDTTFVSAQVSITGGSHAGQDVLSFTNTSATTYGDIGASYNETTGVLSLVSASGTATRLQWQSALRNVRYANASNAPDTATRTISFQIDDGGSVNGLSNIATSTVTITAVNDAPVVTLPVSLAAIRDDSPPRLIAQAELLANASDVDGPSLSALNLQIAAGSLGTLVNNNDGTWTYTRAAGDSSQVNFTYNVSDGALSVATTASLDILPNNAPAAADAAVNTDEDVVLSSTLPAATDADGDDVTYSLAAQATHGTAALDGDGSYTYTPSANFSGSDSFSYTITDGHGGSNTYVVSVTVAPGNNAPVAADAAVNTDEDVVLSSTLPAATDADNDTVTYSRTSQASHGVAVVNSNGSYTYTPAADFNGSDNFTYTVSDGKDGSNTYTVTVAVTPVNDAASISGVSAGAVTVDGGTTANGAVTVSDVDAGEAALVPQTSTAGIYGVFSATAAGAWTYQLNNAAANVQALPRGQSVNDVFTVASVDGTATQQVVITVNGTNDAPVLAGAAFVMNAGDGIVTTDVGGADWGRSVALQADGKIVMAGYRIVSGNADFALVRYNADGTLDTGFGGGDGIVTSHWFNDDQAFSVALQSDGRIVVAGRSNFDVAVARYNTNGSLDTSFGGGVVTTPVGSSGADFGQSVTLQSDGGILVAGYGSFGSNTDFALVRYGATGTLDPTFGTNGIATTAVGSDGDIAYSVALQSDGKIVVVGSSSNGSNDDIALVRYLANGAKDASFGVNGIVTAHIGGNDVGYSVAVQPDGKIVVAGHGNSGLVLLRYDATGTLDPTFDIDGIVTGPVSSSAGYSLALQLDGKIVVAGYGGGSVALVRYNSNGTLDTSFDGDGIVTTPVGFGGNRYSVAVQPDGRIVVAGHSNGAVDTNFVLLRYNANGTLDTSFDGLNIVTEGTPFSFSLPVGRFVDPNGDALVITATLADGTALPGWLDFNPATRTFSGTAPAGEPDLALRVVATDPGGLSVSDIIVLHTNSAPVSADLVTTATEDVVLAGSLPAATDADGNAVTYALAAQATHGTAVVNANGTYTYTPVANYAGADAFTFTVSDGKGGTNTYNASVTVTPVNDAPTQDGTGEQPGNPTGILKFFSGVVITQVGNGADQAIGMAVQPDGKVLTIGYTSLLGPTLDQNFSLVRYNADGSLDTSFNGTGKVELSFGAGNDLGRAVAVQGDGKIVIVGVVDFNNVTTGTGSNVALVRYNADGTLDTTFGPFVSGNSGPQTGIVLRSIGSAVSSDGLNSVVILPGGKILASGYAMADGATSNDFLLMRYNADGTPDLGFGDNGVITTPVDTNNGQDVSQSLAVTSGGQIVLAGWTYASNGVTTPTNTRTNDFAVVRYLSDGSLDTSFSDDGKVTTSISALAGINTLEQGRSVKVLGNGSILVGGWTTTGTGQDFVLLRFKPDGTLDNTFGQVAGAGPARTGYVTTSIGSSVGAPNDNAQTVLVQDDGKIVLVGFATNSSATTGQDIALARYLSDGTLDTSFGSNGIATFAVGPTTTPEQGLSAALLADGRIVVAGFTGLNPNSNTLLAYFRPDGSLDTRFSTNVVVQSGGGAAFSFTIPEGWFGDPEGGPLTYSVAAADGSALPSWFSFNPGTNTFSSIGTLPVGAQDLVLRLTARDDGNLLASQLLTIRVNDPVFVGVNDLVTNEDATAAVSGQAVILDPDGDVVPTFGVTTPATHGTATLINSNGVFTYNYTPFANYSGTDSFVISATDPYGATSGRIVNVTVNPVNDAPVAVNDTGVSTNEDVPVTINVLANDTDVDNVSPAAANAGLSIKAGSVSVVGGGAVGTVGIVSNQIVFTPAANYNGTATINYVTTDGALDSGQASVTVTVTPVNDAPVASAASVSTDEDTVLNGSVSATDVDADILSYSLTTPAANGIVVVNPNGSYTYTPNGNYYGSDSFSYLVNDGHGGTSSASVNITVNPVNDAPHLSEEDVDPEDEPVGVLDGDGSEGVVITNLGAGSDQGYEVVAQPDGKLLVIGQTTTDRGLDIALLRYYPTGQLDATFGTGGKVVLPIGLDTSADVGRGIALQSDGRIVVVGLTTGVDGSDVALLRFDTNGSLDTSFGTGGIVTQPIGLANDAGVAVNVLSDGNILVSGYSASAGTGQDFALLRFDTTGSLDNTFGGGTGYAVTPISPGAGNEAVLATAVQSDGSIIAVGTTTSADGTTSDMALVRYTANGTLDPTFGGGDGIAIQSMSDLAGPFAEGSRAVAVLPDGKILVGGWIASSGSGADLALVRFNSDGSLDTGFGIGGAVTTTVWNPPVSRLDWAFDMVVQPDGKILVTGITDRGSSTGLDVVLARYTDSGALDGNFGDNGDSGITVVEIGRGAITDTGFSVSLQPDGRIVVVGWTGVAGSEDILLLCFDSEGELEEDFGNSLVVNRNADFGLSIPPGMYVDPEGGQLSYSLTLLNGDPLPDWLEFNTETLRISGHPGVGDADVALRIIATDPGGASASRVFNLRVNDAPVAAEATLSTIEDTPLAGNLPPAMDYWSDEIVYSLESPAAHGIVKVNANGTYTYTPANNFNGTDSFVYRVSDIVDEEDGLSNTYMVTVNVTAVDDAPYFQDPNHDNWETAPSIGIVNGDGGAVTTAIGPNQSADAVSYAVLQPDGKIVVAGNALMAGNDQGTAVLRYNPNGTLDTSFGTGGQVVLQNATGTGLDAATTVAVLSDGSILIAGYAVMTGTARDMVLMRLTPAGVPDTGFGGGDGIVFTSAAVPPTAADDQAYNVLVRPDGRIVIVGYTTTANGQDLMLAGFNANGTTDTTFGGGDGIVTTTVSALNDTVYRAVLQPDGKIVATGFTTVGTNNTSNATDIVLARYNADGSTDTSFGGGDGITITSLNGSTLNALEHGRQVAVLDDGKILVGGLTTGPTTGGDFVLLRYTATGTLDTSFGGGLGYVTQTIAAGNLNDFGFDMAVLPNGQILMSGQSGANGNDLAMMRFNANGTLDTSFGGGDGIVSESIGQGAASDIALRVLVQPDGRILLVGTGTTQTGGGDIALMRFNADGSRDVTFGTTLVVNNNTSIQFSIPAYMVVDPEGDPMAFTATLANGSALTTVGLTFDPLTRQFSGTVSSAGDIQIRLTATDTTHGLSSTWPITLHVNHAPSAPAIVVIANQNLGFNSNLVLTPQDVDRDLVTYSVTAPSHGTAAIDASGNYNYVPDANYSGPDAFTYVVTDYYGAQSTGNVTVNVVPTSAISDLLWQQTYTAPGLPGTSTQLATMQATGAQAPVTWTLLGGGGVVSINATSGVVSTTGTAMAANIRYSFIIQAVDNAGASRTEVFDITTGTTGADANLPVLGPTSTSLVGDDILMGLGGNDTIYGGANNDTLLGQDGNDTLRGDAGNDRLFGGAGNDTFVFQNGFGTDVIADFVSGQDKIDLTGVTSPNWATMAEVNANAIDINGGVLIDLGSGNTIFLVGRTEASLTASDFLL